MKVRTCRARNVFLAAVAAFILCSGCAKQQEISQHPCVESKPDIKPENPCVDLSPEECVVRKAYVRAAVASTVGIFVVRYDEGPGGNFYAGTGTVIDGKTVITANHVVRNAVFIAIERRRLADDAETVISERVIPMRVRAFSKENDVALLEPAVKETLALPMPMRRDSSPAVGEPLWHFGKVSYWSHGKVEQTDIAYAGLTGLTQVDFPCRHGDSGGPFVDMSGRLVGVLVRKDGEDGEGHTFFVPLSAALAILGYK